jgi:hypothetical protein
VRTDSWTAEEVNVLKTLWAERVTAVVIGARLGGMSRSAVLGKIFRLRLSAGNAVAGPAAKQKSAAGIDGGKVGAPARRRRGGRRAKSLQLPATPDRQHKTLLELTNKTCRSANSSAAPTRTATSATAGISKAGRRLLR